MSLKSNTINTQPITESNSKIGDVGGIIELLTPENVTMTASLLGAATAGVTAAVKGLQLWIEERKARRIKIKYKDLEVELSGAMSEDEIYRRLEIFRDIKHSLEEKEIKIYLD